MPLETVAPFYGSFNGRPGTAWHNDTNKVLYQLHVDFVNSCGACIQWANAIGPHFPVPFHFHCRCRNIPIYPNSTARPFIDFQQRIRELDPAQQRRVIGAANWKLVEKGVVEWKDVVEKTRVLSLADVIDAKNLSIKQMTDAGVEESIARRSYALAHTPEADKTKRERQAAIEFLKSKGMGIREIRRAVAERLADRFAGTANPTRLRDPGQDLSGFLEAAPWPRRPQPPIPRRRPLEPPLPPPAPPTPANASQKKPVSKGLRLEPGTSTAAAKVFHEVVAYIDEIHEDGSLNETPVVFSRQGGAIFKGENKKTLGLFRGRRNESGHIAGDRIAINSAAASRDLSHATLAHEIGHFIDWVGFQDKLDKTNSVAYRRYLAAVDKSREVVEFRQNGIRDGYTKEAIEYILDPREVWARSYAQWIGDRAARKGHVDNPIRKSMREPAASKLQWSDESFAPIGQAIDDIFRELGWLKE